MKLEALLSTGKTLVSFLVWLDLTNSFAGCADVLAAVSRGHLEVQLLDPSKEYNVKRVYKALLKEYKKDKEPNWPRDPLPVSTLRCFVDNKPQFTSREFWVRDAALVAIGLRTMRHPGELCNLRLRDIKFSKKLCWVRVVSSKTDQFANGRFLPIEATNRGQLLVGAVGAIVKRVAENAKVQGRYTAHSIRIGGATAAMAAGLSLAQIRTIGGWDSKAIKKLLEQPGIERDNNDLDCASLAALCHD
ncbi:11578_t:CDS:2 [Gigaspora margarita]|uniref:11578_t:CDS:1 n=1 Tax=Gigaspora margarita TaxID=4874 RepID=A0ABN7UHC7_GIGMA|nr:11578_t:CDS:2 [Gigaspora margarita]